MANSTCLASCHGSHETHPWHDALDTVARHGGGLQRTPYLTGDLATAEVTFPSIVAASDWATRSRAARDVRISAHSETFDRPVWVTLEWISLA